MKIFIPIIILLISFEINAQDLTLNETIEYLEEFYSTYSLTPYKHKITCTKYGKIEHRLIKENGYIQEWEFNIEEVIVANQYMIQDGIKTDELAVIISCEKFNCIYYNYIDPSGNIKSSLKKNKIGFYLKENEQAIKIKKALLHLQKLIKKQKDPFED